MKVINRKVVRSFQLFFYQKGHYHLTSDLYGYILYEHSPSPTKWKDYKDSKSRIKKTIKMSPVKYYQTNIYPVHYRQCLANNKVHYWQNNNMKNNAVWVYLSIIDQKKKFTYQVPKKSRVYLSKLTSFHFHHSYP